MNAKQILLTAMMLGCACCFGAANDTLVSFSTKGPDTYGDGSTVLDGECYALVWTKAGGAFGGFNADGTLVSADDRLVTVASLAKGGRCPSTLFEVDAADAAKYADGTFALYLLDTRVRGADGKVAVGGAGVLAVGATGVAVNAAGAAAAVESDGSTVGRTGSAVVRTGAVALAEVGVYSKLGEPRITGLKVEGATVELKVEEMSDVADYFVVRGATPGRVGETLPTTVDGETLKVAKPEGDATFFRVIGARKFK